MDLIQPKMIQSPISGEPIRPTLRTYIKGNQELHGSAGFRFIYIILLLRF